MIATTDRTTRNTPGIYNSLKDNRSFRHEISDIKRARSAGPTKRSKVLVVEDCLSSRLVMGYFLDSLGFNVTACASAEEALKLGEETRFDMIFMDVGLPGMSGLEAIPKLRRDKIKSHLAKIIVCSAYKPGKAAKRDKNVHYLQKPFNKLVLKNKLSEILGRALALESIA